MIHTYFKSILLSLLLINSTYGQVETTVFDYDENGKFVETKVILEDLVSDNKLDGKYFKIVLGKTDDAVNLVGNDHSQRAAHIYYHLSQARKYFKKLDIANHTALDNKIIIRINIKNAFDNFGHFAHDEFAEEYNTAVTIPASDEYRIPSISAWTKEIWFRPGKEIFIPGQLGMLGNLLNERSVKTNLQVIVLENAIAQIISDQLFNGLVNNASFLTIGVGIAAIEFFPRILLRVGSRIKNRFFLDTAMVPEIIYHEYSHYALSDYVDLTSTPVVEGLANYFAGKISNKAHWGNGPYTYTTDRGRNALSTELYEFRVESKMFSTGDFVFKFLWGLQNIFGKKNTDTLIYSIRKDLNGKSDIKSDLVDSIFNHLGVIKSGDINHRMKLHIYMQGLGL